MASPTRGLPRVLDRKMHRFHSTSVIFRLKVASLLLCSKYLLAPAALGLLGYSLVIGEQRLILVGYGLVMLTMLSILVQWLVGSRARCPLCMTPVLVKKDCSKHRHSKPLLGSYRLPVALGILFRGTFICPYCHEPAVMEVRHRRKP